MGWFGFIGTFKIIYFQPPCHGVPLHFSIEKECILNYIPLKKDKISWVFSE